MLNPSGPKPNWLNSIWFVLLMLFLVMGPLGLPLLWKSPSFSKRAKIILTVATMIYTGFILLGARAAVERVLHTPVDI